MLAARSGTAVVPRRRGWAGIGPCSVSVSSSRWELSQSRVTSATSLQPLPMVRECPPQGAATPARVSVGRSCSQLVSGRPAQNRHNARPVRNRTGRVRAADTVVGCEPKEPDPARFCSIRKPGFTPVQSCGMWSRSVRIALNLVRWWATSWARIQGEVLSAGLRLSHRCSEDRADRHSSGPTNTIESKMARASLISAGLDSVNWSTAITARSPFRSTTR
jgi:hypothetical protein